MGHAKFAPSSAYRWLKCPGSVNMELMVPERETNGAAKIGTLIHTLAEEFLSIGVSTLDDELFSETVGAYDHGLELDELEQFKNYIQIYIYNINDIIKSNDPTEVLFEKKVSVLQGECYGTADALLYNNHKVIVADLKTGRGLISPENNPQLLCYLLGATNYLILDKGFTFEQLADFKFEAVIIQPFDPDIVKTYIYSFSDIETFKNRLINAYRTAYNHERVTLNSRIYEKHLIDIHFKEEEGLSAGSHCKWCPALGICKKARDAAIPARIQKSISDLPLAETLSPDQLRQILEKKNDIEKFLDSIQERVITLLSCGEDVDGFELGHKRTLKRWKSELEVKDIIKIEFPELYEDCFTEKKLRSPAQLAKLLGAEFVSSHTFKPIGKPSVLPTKH